MDRDVVGATRPLAAEPEDLGARLAQREEQLHEMRSTLAGVVSAVRLLAHQGGLLSQERVHQLAATLDTELERIERLLNPARRGGLGVLQLDDVLAPVVAARRATGQQVFWEPNGALVRGQADEIAQVLSILLVNAAQHAPGSPVWVDVDSGAHEVRLRVRDEGPGIPVEDRERVLRRGVRGPHSAGDGLGLHVASRLVHGLNGSLRVLPSERGAVFEVSLPSGAVRVAS